jgi:cytoskeletal protein CcmA (bactofilin family)
MAYLLNKTDGTLLINLVDGTADGPDINPGQNVSDLDLFGKNYPLYGQWLDENFVRLLQNFANSTAPTKPLPGELWYDTGSGFLKVYTGTVWKLISPVLVSNTAPISNSFGSVIGTQWWDVVNYQLNTWNGTGWTLIGPAYKQPEGVSGAIVEDILDTVGGTHTVIKFYHNNNVVAISSYDAAFTISPANPVPGFGTIAPGFTLATGIANEVEFVGSATNAKMLGNVVAANYARTDIVPTFSSNILIANGNISIDSAPSGTARYYNNVLNANVSIWANVAGTATALIRMVGSDTSTRVYGPFIASSSITAYGVTSTGATGTGNMVFSANSTLTGTTTTSIITTSALQNTSLTAGRVVYSTTGGTETDSGNLTFDGSTLSANNLSVSYNATITGNLYATGNVISQGPFIASSSITAYGVTSTGATGTGQLVFNTNPVFGGVVFAANVSSGIIQNTSLTAGRVVYSTTGGTETDSGNLTFDGSTLGTTALTVTNNASIGGTLAVTGHVTLEGKTSTGATGTGNLVFSASPTVTGTLTADAISFNGTLTASQNINLNSGKVTINATTGDIATVGNLSVGQNITIYGTTPGGVTGVGNIVLNLNPTLTGTPTAPTASTATSTTQIASTEFVKNAIPAATNALWLGSSKTVSTNLPDNSLGNNGDFWFQI